MNLISYLKAHMHNKLLLVILTTLLSCFSTINSMELTKTQPPLLQKLSTLSKDPEVRRAAKFVAISAGVCAVALSLKKLLQSPEPAANPALITAQPQPAQAAASPVVTQASSDSASGVEISSEQRTVNEAIDLLLDQHSKASWGDQGSIKTNLFSILVLSC
ncbi:MAG TPA: hypothetical protein VFF04_05755 [Candidatus Babeliales bacterium]|nr:hypothetical protein [Candidatus Babeliales bacterium]